MSIPTALAERAESKCELCSSTDNLQAYTVSPKSGEEIDEQIAACTNCIGQIDAPDTIDPNHWRCLNDSMWSPIPAVQVTVYRMLKKLNTTDWAGDLINMMYMDDATKEWAESASEVVVHKDSNGHILQAGDTVVLIKDLKVKGANFTAKRGTAVRRISLVADNAGHIEGKVEGQRIVILTQYVKKG